MQSPICGFLCALALLVSAANAEEPRSKPRAFFAFDNGVRQTEGLEEKAALLAQLGYDGIAWRPGKTAEMLKALDHHGLKMFATYVTLTAGEEACRVPPGVVLGALGLAVLTLHYSSSEMVTALGPKVLATANEVSECMGADEATRKCLTPCHLSPPDSAEGDRAQAK